MKRYVLATQQPWGVKAFYLLVPPDNHQWTCVGSNVWLKATIEKIQPRYVFFLHWSDIIPPDILAMTECVNFHCTKLPYGRGGAPIENLIMRGHTETVIAAHRMVEELDAGPIYGTRGPISLAGTKAEILERFIEPCVDLIRWIVETEPVPVPQQGEVVTFTRLPPAEYDAFWKARA